jgi:hypothetical protein
LPARLLRSRRKNQARHIVDALMADLMLSSGQLAGKSLQWWRAQKRVGPTLVRECRRTARHLAALENIAAQMTPAAQQRMFVDAVIAASRQSAQGS